MDRSQNERLGSAEEIVWIVGRNAGLLQEIGFDPSRFRVLVTPAVLGTLLGACRWQQDVRTGFRARDSGDGWYPEQVGVCYGYPVFIREAVEGGVKVQSMEEGVPLDYGL